MKIEDMMQGTINVMDDGTLPKEESFVLSVEDWELDPFIRKGDYILFVSRDDIEVGQIGAWLKDGRFFVKQKADGVLRSLVPTVPDIPLTDEWRCIGKLHGTVKAFEDNDQKS